MKKLDLTLASMCKDKHEIAIRNEAAEEYSRSVRNENTLKKIQKMQFIELLIIAIPTLYLFTRMLF